MNRIGVIGGSGLYGLEGLKKLSEEKVNTPYGEPSDVFTICELDTKQIVFLPRHGRHHQINPSNINYRANIYGMKKLGVTRLISISACGSLKEEIKPLDFVIVGQFVDRTQGRKFTFFDQGAVAHVSFAQPVCRNLAQTLKTATDNCGVTAHQGGTYLNMEGPQFSTIAESNLYRSWGMDIIGMTNLAEARLAREAEICYVTLAAVTDYDCWHPSHETVTLEQILNNLAQNVDNSRKILKVFLTQVDPDQECSCQQALKYAIITRPEFISDAAKQRLGIIIKKYAKK